MTESGKKKTTMLDRKKTSETMLTLLLIGMLIAASNPAMAGVNNADEQVSTDPYAPTTLP